MSAAETTCARKFALATDCGTAAMSVQSVIDDAEDVRRNPVAPSCTMSCRMLSHDRACVSAPVADCENSVTPPESRPT